MCVDLVVRHTKIELAFFRGCSPTILGGDKNELCMGYVVFTVESLINTKTGHVMSCRLELGLEACQKKITVMFANA